MITKFFLLLREKIIGIFLAAIIAIFNLNVYQVHASVIGWGTNDLGQLNIPTNLIGAKAVTSGYWHGLAITASNTVVAWGIDDYGQTNVPTGLTGVVGIAAGIDHSLALLTNGTVVGWGVTSNLYFGDPDWYGQADVPTDVTNAIAISAGAFHSLVLKADGTVETWGYDFYGQCDVPAGLSNVVAIACGGYFSLALKNDGTVAAWGDDYYGQTNIPADLTNVVGIAAGGLHGLALKADGTVEGWGARGTTDFTQDFGQENAPVDLTNAVSIAAGFFHSLALKSDGTVRQWGDTSLGQTNPPTGLRSVLAIAGGYAHSYALKNDFPIFLTQPTNVVTATNKAVSFAVQASGATPLRATWYRTGLNTNLGSVVYSNTTVSASFTGGSVQGSLVTNQSVMQFSLNLLATYSALTNASTNTFYLVVTNSLGSVTSSVASLTVLLPPKITSQPVNVATNLGATVFFTVGTSGSQPLGYQWFFNGTNNPVGANSNVLELDNVDTNSAGNYSVLITNAVGSVTSSNAVLTVDGSPIITVQPTNTSVVVGSNTTFTVAASGADPLTYQWYFYQTNSSISALPDGTNVSYALFNAQTNNAGKYFLIVSNNFNSVTSSVVSLTVLTPPLLLTQPTNVVTATNKAVSFAVQASGATPLRATWYRTGLNTNLGSVVYSNTTVSASFTGGSVQGSLVTNQSVMQFSLNLLATYSALTNASTNTFYLVVTNSLGSVTSSVASLTVLLPPKITSQPVNVATNLGATVFFTVGTSGSQPLGYQWFFNGTNNPVGANSNVLELDNVDTNSAGNYSVLITNAVGSVTSSLGILYILVNGSLTAPQLWLLSHDPANGDGIMIALQSGRNYRVQSSTDLSQWIDVTNFLSQSSLVIFTNSQFINLPSLYYRVVTP